jgi:hypothetical protein
VKKSIRIIAAAAICLAAQNSFAQTTFGGADCGQWLAEKTPTRKLWLAGYLSGLSVMHAANLHKGDPLGELSSMDQAYAWMDNYCRKNPLEDVRKGGLDLFTELMLKVKARTGR